MGARGAENCDLKVVGHAGLSTTESVYPRGNQGSAPTFPQAQTHGIGGWIVEREVDEIEADRFLQCLCQLVEEFGQRRTVDHEVRQLEEHSVTFDLGARVGLSFQIRRHGLLLAGSQRALLCVSRSVLPRDRKS